MRPKRILSIVQNVETFASQLTGPILVKNPALLKIVVQAIYRHRGETCPEIPVDQYMAEGWAITAEQLKARCTK